MTEQEEILLLKEKVDSLERQVVCANSKVAEKDKSLSLYEVDGSKSLFYALNRKSNEMALLLNRYNLVDMDLTSSNKEFERLQKIWADSTGLAQAVKSLEQTSGVTLDESKDLQPKFRITPESVADNMGNVAGMKKQS